jgi:hypothetical protein
MIRKNTLSKKKFEFCKNFCKKMLFFRKKKILNFRNIKQILLRQNEFLLRKNKFLFRKNELIFRRTSNSFNKIRSDIVMRAKLFIVSRI